MDNWFLRDARGGHVGPMSRQVAVDLLRSRPGVFVAMSADGREWKPIARHERAEHLVAEVPSGRRSRENVEATQLVGELTRLRGLSPHELFGVPKSASLRDFRAGFAARAKHVHPGRLPVDASPALVRARMALYQYLTEVLQSVERQFETPKATQAPANEWSLTRLRLHSDHDRLSGALDITESTAQVFTIHRLMNLSNNSVFLPCVPTLSLGTKIRLTFSFLEAQRRVEALGAVALEAVAADVKTHLRGFGVMLDGLDPASRQFMQREAARLMAH